MSAAAPAQPVSLAALGAKSLALLAILGLASAVSYFAPAEVPYAAPVAGLALFLLVGDLLAELVERVKLPHLSGYLIAGVIVGPHGLGTVSAAAVDQLSMVNTLALALIALSAGAELTFKLLRSGAVSLLAATFTQVLIALPVCTLGFFALKPFISFLDGMELQAVLGVSLLWGTLAISRSPSATLGLIAQVRPDGPLTRYTLSLVIAFDIIVLILFAAVIQLTRSMVDPALGFDMAALTLLGEELVGSIAAGTTLGLLVTLYLRVVGRQLILFLVVISYGVTQFSSYFNYDTLLLFVVAGFIVANVSHQGEKLLEAVSQGGRVVYVLFFANAGAHLDLPLLAQMWPIALGLAGTRVLGTILAAKAGSKLAKDEEVVRRYGWMPLVSQAGVTIGMVVVVSRMFGDTFGPGMASLAVAVVGVNEAVGPILFKLALDRAGETGKALEKHSHEGAASGASAHAGAAQQETSHAAG